MVSTCIPNTEFRKSLHTGFIFYTTNKVYTCINRITLYMYISEIRFFKYSCSHLLRERPA